MRETTATDVLAALRRRLRKPTSAFPRPDPLVSRSLRGLIRSGAASLGVGSYAYPDVHRHDDRTRLDIGKYTSISRGVTIVLGGEHRPDWVTTSPLRIMAGDPAAGKDGTPRSRGDVRIGNDVWVATNAIILSGVTIGDGAVVGAASLVLDDVLPYTIVAGAPAKPIRERFQPDVIAALQAIAWWDWSEAEVAAAIPLLCQPDIGAFLQRYANGGSPPIADNAIDR